MSTDAEERRIDEKGRITIPKSIREQLGLSPGKHIEIEIVDGRIVIQPRISREQFVEAMEGCLTEETRREDAPRMDPLELSSDWISDLPDA